MPKITLGQVAIQEIRDAMAGLRGAHAAAEARTLAEHHNISISRIYDITDDLRPRRKARADKGKRKVSLMENEGLRFAAELVALKHVKPDFALMTARLQGYEVPTALGTFQRYLREHGVNRKANMKNLRPHRRFEAAAPGERYQIDISGVKERWLDVRTRRILHVSSAEVNENHPNKLANRVKVWKFSIVDDYSRFKFFRFYAVARPRSQDVVDFCLHAFRAMGVPKVLYSDNDVTIIGKRMQRAAAILDRAFADCGGFRLEQHLPHNAQATGKVERSHQIIEEFEKLIGVKYTTPGLDELNQFAERVCAFQNEQIHSTTGEKPALRWRNTLAEKRMPPSELLDAAFKADEFERVLKPDLTVTYATEIFQLPRSAQYPFVNWIGQKITIVWPGAESEFFVVVGLDGNEYEISRTLAVADVAGEFKSVAETTRQQTIKSLKESAAQRKQGRKERGEDLLVPFLDNDPAADLQKPVMFPQKEITPDLAAWAEASPGFVPPSISTGRYINQWEAITLLQEQGKFETPVAAGEKAWLVALFNGREEINTNELYAAIDAKQAPEQVQPVQSNVLRLVRSA